MAFPSGESISVGENGIDHCLRTLDDSITNNDPALLVDFNQGWRLSSELRGKLATFLNNRKYIIRTNDLKFDEWKILRRDNEQLRGKGIWFSPISDMDNGNLWVSSVWEYTHATIIKYLKDDTTLFENERWLHYIVILLSKEGVLILGPDTGKNGILLITKKEQPGSFSINNGYRKVIGGNIIFVSSLLDAIFEDNISKETIKELSKAGLLSTRKLIKLGYAKYDNSDIETTGTNLPVNQIIEYWKGIIENRNHADREQIIAIDEFENNKFKVKNRPERNTLDDAIYIVKDKKKDFEKRIVLEIGEFKTPTVDYSRNILRIFGQLEEYILSDANKKVYSCAIFGEPGSGKSFMPKALIKAIRTKTRKNISEKPISYNISQFEDVEPLNNAFKDIQKKSLTGEIPVVIWDEFDSYLKDKEYGWLSHFLMPMQDSEFFDNGKIESFGKCIFIFIGGTFESEDKFIKWTNKKSSQKLKGKDFHSRLDSCLSVPKINPTTPKPNWITRINPFRKPANWITTSKSEERTIRALMLREFLAKYTEVEEIAKDVLVYLLHVRLQHGVRSLEKIIKNSELKQARTYQAKHLPPVQTLKLHVKDIKGGGEKNQVEMYLSKFNLYETYSQDSPLILEWRRENYSLFHMT